MTDFRPFAAEQTIKKCKAEIAWREFQYIPSRVEHKHRSTTNHVLREQIHYMSVMNPLWYKLEFALYDCRFKLLRFLMNTEMNSNAWDWLGNVVRQVSELLSCRGENEGMSQMYRLKLIKIRKQKWQGTIVQHVPKSKVAIDSNYKSEVFNTFEICCVIRSQKLRREKKMKSEHV